MGRRSDAANLIGLAGLATLGYHLMKGRGKNNAPVKTLAAESKSESKAEPDYGEDYDREVARGGRGQVGIGAVKTKAPRAEVPKSSPAKTEEKPSEKTSGTADDVMRREMDKEAGMTRGTRPADPRDRERSMSRGRRPTPNVAGDYTRKMGATAEEIAEYRNREINPPPMTPAMRRQAEQQGLERVTPEEMLIGGPGLKTLHTAAKGLANRAPAAREMVQQALPAPTPRLTGPSKADLLARDRAARAATRQDEMLKENARRYGLDPNAPGYEGAAGAVRRGMGGDEFTLMKKGGSTRKAVAKKASYAKGGAVKKETKPAAKGWGMARGGRAAKIY